ncbi:uncharacterized protein LOC134231771 [Saccostrea cucullata]|uniref:uncharacterized protein LOC134231771 n=1 Tax=Saccostrea cuccullata TaxID=36930 RepID=UPI002ED6C0FA
MIISIFNDAYEKEEWENFNSMYYRLLLREIGFFDIPRSYMMDLYRFVERNIGPTVKKVYYGFCLQRKQSVIVIVIDNVFCDKKKTTTYKGLPILYKQWIAMTEESLKTRKYERYEDSPTFNEDVHAKLHQCMRRNSAILMRSHSNIEIIGASPYRSMEKGKRIRNENCILIYCTMKNVIPLGETFFAENLGEFRIDIREGFFYTYPRSMDAPLDPKDRHSELKIGAEISREDGNLIGTLGGFVNFGIRKEIGFITCAHVIHDEPEKMIENDTRVVQPSSGPSWENNVCGVVIKSVHPRSSDATTVDASLVKVDSSRKPTRMSFTGLGMDKIAKLKFSPDEIYEGKIREDAALNASCYKFGATTNFTSGKLESRLLTAIHLSDFRDPGQNFEYHDQYTVSSISSVFADHGDSGAFVFQCMENSGKKSLECIGMVVGGTSDFKIVVTPIREVLNALDLHDTKKLCTFEDEQMETDVTDEKPT